MSTTKQNIIDAVSFMNDSDADFLWNTILDMYAEPNGKIIHLPVQEAFYSRETTALHTSKEVIPFADYKHKKISKQL